MTIIDNFDLMKSHMTFNSPDEFYFVQILIRGKDGHTEKGVNGNNKNRLIKYYIIRSLDELDRWKHEIISICHALNARAYIHPTKRSFHEVAKEAFRIFTDSYVSENVLGLRSCYSTACGKSKISKDKKFIVDLDGINCNICEDIVKASEIMEFINTECDPVNVQKEAYIVPTAHGIHLVTKPFNVDKFRKRFPDIDVHKNNPTLLYFECHD